MNLSWMGLRMEPFEFDFSQYFDSSSEDGIHWNAIRDSFLLDKRINFLDTLLLTSHPKWVRESILFYQMQLDRDPGHFWEENIGILSQSLRESAADYLECDPSELGFCASSTVGMGLIYGGLDLPKNSEILFTDQAHYSHFEAIRFSAARGDLSPRKIELYDHPFRVSLDDILSRLKKSISERTRVISLTWLQSSTGVKLPISEICQWIETQNLQRDPSEKIYVFVDGVHGFGVENISVKELRCDAFVTSCHKWLFGPRGTGLFWLSSSFAERIRPVVPCYDGKVFSDWIRGTLTSLERRAEHLAPGGFLSFEYQWSLKAAFDFHLAIGRKAISQRTKKFASRIKEAMMEMSHVQLITPRSEELSSALVCFEVEGFHPTEVIDFLRSQNIAGTTTPYNLSYARLTPSILNTECQIDLVIDVLSQFPSVRDKS